MNLMPHWKKNHWTNERSSGCHCHGSIFSEDDIHVEDNNEYKTESVPESHWIVTPNNTDRVDSNPEYLPRIQHKINIPEVPTPSWTVFNSEQNELFDQYVVQDTQGLEGESLYYHILGLNESATEDDLKKPIVNWLFNPSLTKISIHRLLLSFAWYNRLSKDSEMYFVVMIQ